MATRKNRRSLARVNHWLEQFALTATDWTGRSAAFAIAVGVILVWGALGPVSRYSDTWQLVINTGTTIVTFLMVFLIQRTQNKEARVTQMKLNEIVAALEGASNRLIDLEDLSEDEIETLHEHYRKLVAMAKRDANLLQSHSIEEAEARHEAKHGRKRSASGAKHNA
ncbi:MAG: low affinity iron permease family protein [Candidatus Binatia bacterium]